MLFELAPEGVVDAGGIVDVEDFAAFGSALAQLVYGEALEGAHFVFFAAGDLIGEGEVAEAMRAQIEGVDVAGGEFGITGWAGFAGLGEIVDGGGMGVAVGGVEVEVVKRVVGSKGVGHGARHGGAEGGIGFCAEGEAAFALEEEEKPADGRQAQLGLHRLEEIPSAADVFHDPADAELKPIGIGDFRAGAKGFEFGEQGEEWPKKMGVESRGWIYGNGHKKTQFFMLGKSREKKGLFGFIGVLQEFR